MFSNNSYVLALYDEFLGENQHWRNREAWVYSQGVHTRDPFQGSLYGLPPATIAECIVGAIEARYGAIDAKAGEPGASAATNAASPSLPAAPPKDFESFIYKTWGAGIARHFAIPTICR